MPLALGIGIFALIALALGSSASASSPAPAPTVAPLDPGYGGVLPLPPGPGSAAPSAPLPAPPTTPAPPSPALATQETLSESAAIAHANGNHELAAEIESRIPSAPSNAAVAQAATETVVPSFETELARQNPSTRQIVENALADGNIAHRSAIMDLSTAMLSAGNRAIASALDLHAAEMTFGSSAPVTPATLPIADVAPSTPLATVTPAVVPGTSVLTSDASTVVPSVTITPASAVASLPPNAQAPAIEAAVNQDIAATNPAASVAATPAANPGPTLAETNRATAVNLAPIVAADVRSKRYNYSRARLRDVQTLMGLAADGIYGPGSEAMLRDLGVSNPPRHLFA